jgi:sRNA-binding regulator protein Hfq
MSVEATLPSLGKQNAAPPAPTPAPRRSARSAMSSYRMPAYAVEQETPQQQAEVFYLQKQIQSQTPMILVLEDGEQVKGCIEWYDRNVLKIRGRTKTLVYKSAIKYMYKVGDFEQ